MRENLIGFLSSVTGAAEDVPEKYDHIRNSLARTVDAASEDLSKIEEQCKELEIDERDLAEKIRKKSQDLEQSQKRLKSLKNVRPAFMDEYEKLEMELQDHYNVYLERFRNLHYLQKELEMCEKEQSEKYLLPYDPVPRKLIFNMKRGVTVISDTSGDVIYAAASKVATEETGV